MVERAEIERPSEARTGVRMGSCVFAHDDTSSEVARSGK